MYTNHLVIVYMETPLVFISFSFFPLLIGDYTKDKKLQNMPFN